MATKPRFSISIPSALIFTVFLMSFSFAPDNNSCETSKPFGSPSGNVFVVSDNLVVTISSTNESCFQANDGTATAMVTGGSGNYEYLWSNAQTTAMITDLNAGLYGVTVTDLSNSETSSANIVITQPDPLNVTVTVISDVTCSDPTATATAVVSGGTEPYQFLWENGETTATAANLGSGIQTVTVTDANGCVETDQFTVFEDTTAPVADAGDDVARDCNDPGPQFILDGSLSSEGPQYSYFWSTSDGHFVSGITTQFPKVDELGTYTLLVTDNSNGCTATDDVVVYEDFEMPIPSAGPSVSICEGDCHTLNASASSGTPPYNFIWADGHGSGPTIVVCPIVTTTYTVTVTGSNGCSAADQVTVFVNDNPSLNLHSVDCSADQESYTVTVLTNGDMVNTSLGFINNQGSGLYTIENIPIDSASVTITATITNTACFSELIVPSPVCGCPDIPAPEASGNIVICQGEDIPTLFAEAPEGMVVDWYDSALGGTLLLANSEEFTPDAPGVYFAESRDPTGDCTSEERTSVSIIVNEPPEVTIFQDGNFCEGDCGILTAMGDELASYEWASGQATATIFICTAGTYSVTVSDIYGCVGEASIDISPLPIPIADAGPDVVLDCQNTEITIGSTNSSTGEDFAYTWSNGANTLTQTISEPGEYFLTVVNTTTNCHDVDLAIVTQDVEPPTADAGEDVCISCATGVALLEAPPAGQNEELSWSFMGVDIPNNPIFVSEPGPYVLEVINTENGCSATDTVMVDLCSMPEITTVSMNDVLCNGEASGSVSFSVSGGEPPYVFEGLALENDNLSAGTYIFSVTDANLCLASTTVTINEPDALSIATSVSSESGSNLNDGTASAVALGGTPGYAFSWSTGETTPGINNLAPGTYSLTVSDANGCTEATSVTVENFDCIEMNVSISGTGVICPGDETGFLEVSVDNGGTAPFSYVWSNGNTADEIQALGAGVYTCTVTDANNCQQSATFEISTEDSEPPVLVTQNITLYLDEAGQASFMPWDIDGGSTDNCGLDSIWVSSTEFHCGNIGAHVVQVMVFDFADLSVMGSAMVSVVDTIAPSFVSCPEDMMVSGCSTVDYTIPVALDNCASPEVELLTGFLPGEDFPEGTTEVAFTAADPSGNNSLCSFTVTVAEVFSAQVEQSTFQCGDGTITATIVPEGGTPPYGYQWSTGSLEPSLSFVGTATVSWTVTDAAGCSLDGDLTISVPDELLLEIVSTPELEMQGNGTADATVSGGVAPYSYVWTIDGAVIASTEDLDNLSAGTYCLIVTDALGCVVTSCTTIDQVTDTEETSFTKEIIIAPNPVRDVLNVNFEFMDRLPADLELFNDKGQFIQQLKKEPTQNMVELQTSFIPDGLYFIKIIIEGKVVVKKFVVCK